MVDGLTALLGLGGSVRLLLSCSAPLHDALRSRLELATPLTAYNRLLDGFYVRDVLGRDPYDGGSFHHSPVLLPFALVLEHRVSAPLAFALADLATTWLVHAIASYAQATRPRGTWNPTAVAAIYALHPFGILSCLARSTAGMSNFFVAAAILAACHASTIACGALLSVATALSLYPALLLPPLALLTIRSSSLKRDWTAATSTVCSFALATLAQLVVVRYLITGNWLFLKSVYGVILTTPDLTPNIGLYWYFFIEMFDHFRAFFLGVFQLHTLAYVAPLCIAFSDDPLFATTLLVGVIAIFKSYPALGDFTLWHALVACHADLFPHLSRALFAVCTSVYALALLPSFSALWLKTGQGNANFFYAATLVWALAQGGALVDLLTARVRQRALDDLRSRELRDKVLKGEIMLVQR